MIWNALYRESPEATASSCDQNGGRGLMLSLVSDVAAAYFELVQLDRRLELAHQSRDAFQATYKLFGERFAGTGSKLQLTRAESALGRRAGYG